MLFASLYYQGAFENTGRDAFLIEMFTFRLDSKHCCGVFTINRVCAVPHCIFPRVLLNGIFSLQNPDSLSKKQTNIKNTETHMLIRISLPWLANQDFWGEYWQR